VDPEVVLVVGVNGVGKTTSLAKLVQREKSRGRKPLIVASDTFRAAASEQLEIWAQRLDVDIVRSRTGADPGSVAFDGIRAAQSRGAGVVFVDTAGRLQTKGNLMDELAKIHRVCGKALSGAPHETLLVLDATIGQNALSQARLFSEAVPLTGIVLAKLDGTSKGGVILAIAHELKIPVRYVGVGEQAEDLLDFDPGLFAEGLVGEVPERVAS
jgi:fused signal recognition particle receptor